MRQGVRWIVGGSLYRRLIFFFILLFLVCLEERGWRWRGFNYRYIFLIHVYLRPAFPNIFPPLGYILAFSGLLFLDPNLSWGGPGFRYK